MTFYCATQVWGLERALARKMEMWYRFTMLTKRKKTVVIKDAQTHETDTGSPEVQISILTKRINDLTTHLKKHAKDKHSRRGLLAMVADRRTHLRYLEKKNKRRYNSLLKKLDLKR